MTRRPTNNWSNPGSAAVGRGVSTRVWKALAVLTGLAACVGAITYVVLWLTPPTAPRLLVATADYERNLTFPVSTTTAADAQRLVELDLPGRARLQPDPAPYRLTVGGTGRMLDELARSRTPTVVAVFAANGGCDADGPFLIPDDATGDRTDRVRVRAVLDAAAKLPTDTHKLIVFDIANTSAPVIGQFHNDFARGVQALEADIAGVPNLLVVVSAGVNQRAWRSPEWGESVFLHHLRNGLAGAADANGDARLSADELIEYVTRQTRNWARDQRVALQVPAVFPPTDDGRQAEMMLGVVPNFTRKEPLPATFTPQATWETMWKRFDALDRSTPHPTAYAPKLWDEYVKWVMRSDRLLADGNEAAAARAADDAERTRQNVLTARALPVSPQTLSLPTALGEPGSHDVSPALIGKVALATAADQPAEWEQAKKQADRLALGRALLNWVADDPFARLRLAPPVVALISEGFDVVPAELHFLSMLARDLPEHPQTAAVWPLMRTVLRLRLSAEQTALGGAGEDVRPWIADALASADGNRRNAEDLLFAGDDGWAKAENYSRAAERQYAEIADTALAVRSAYFTWHSGSFWLNGVTEWLAAGDHPNDLLGRMTREELLASVRRTWADLHRVGRLLAGPPSPDGVAELQPLSASVAERVNAARGFHRAAVAELLDNRPGDDSRKRLAAWWYAADMALSVPFSERRAELLTEHRRASRQLHVLARTQSESLDEPTTAEVEERAFDAARRRGLLHLSALGREAFTLAAGDGFDRTEFQIDQFSRQADAPAELIAAGEAFAQAVRQLPEKIPTNDDDLTTADRFARSSLIPPSVDPAIRLRAIRAEQLLLWQADRTTTDRWSGGGTAKPYFRHAADILRDNARTLTGHPAAPPTPPPPFPFTTTAPAEVIVTDEPKPHVAFTLARVPSSSGGFVTYSGSGGERFVRDNNTPPEPIVLGVPPRTESPPDTPVVEKSVLAIRAYFRGEVSDTRVNVARHPTPHVTAVRRLSDNAMSVAVRPTPDVRAKYGVGSGHLHFVIDCSGSMGKGDDPTAEDKYSAACDKLEEVLNAVPKGVSVAVSAFGQRTPGVDVPEDTFATLRPAAVWAGSDDTAGLMTQLRALQPWNKSAVTQSVLQARAGVPDVSPRAVVLFSDCADNRFTDPLVNAKKGTVKDALRSAFGDGCPLHVVAFPVSEAEAVQADYRSVTTHKPAGLFVTPDETGKLIDWIRAATAPQVRLKLVRASGNADDLSTGSETADNWLSPLPPAGKYSLRLPALELEQPVNVWAGERLLLALSVGDNGLQFTRPNFATEVSAVARKKAGEWTAAVPRQRLTDAGGLEVIALADRASAPEGGSLSPARVADVWFELAPSNNSPVAVRWANSTGWPCPAWELTCPKWPAEGVSTAVPTLSAWWSADRPFDPTGTLKLQNDTPLSLKTPAVVSTSAGEIAVSELAVEKHDGRACLAVRLSHPAGVPLYPRVTGNTPAAVEVRCYRDANRVTAFFWWDDANGMNAITGLEFVAVADAKKQAAAAGTVVELPQLPPPTVGTPSPTPAPR